MEKLPLTDKIIIAVSLIATVLILRFLYSSGQHPRMPDIDPILVPKTFSNTNDILVLPLWVMIPCFETETQDQLYNMSSSFIVSDLQFISSNLKRPKFWNIVTPGFRIGNRTEWLRGIYIFLKTGEIVWMRARTGFRNEWGYIKWSYISKQWQNELITAIGKGKASRNKESNADFWGAEYGSDMRIIVELSPDEKKMIKNYLDSIDYGKITNGGQWKLMFE